MGKDNFWRFVKQGAASKEGSRHERRANKKPDRKLAKLKKRYPAEAAEAMRRIEERENRK